jgi:hypothetical protein
MGRDTAFRILLWGTGIIAVLLIPAALSGGREDVGTFLAMVLTFGFVAFLVLLTTKLRTEPIRDATRAEARHLGLAFAERDPFELLDGPFAVLRRGGGGIRDLRNVQWGTWRGRDVRAFDFTYTPAGDAEHPVELSCAMVAEPRVGPHLVIAREAPVGRAASVFGLRDVEFESEEFNRAFRVTCDDRRFAYAIVDARMISWLLSLAPEWGFEGAGGWVLAYGRRRYPWEIEEVLGAAEAFASRIPEHVAGLFPPARRDLRTS